MKIKYVVRVTIYCIDGMHKTIWRDFGANYDMAKAYADKESARKLRLCDVRKEVRLRMLPDDKEA